MHETYINKSMKGIISQYREEIDRVGITPRSKESQSWFEEKLSELSQPIDRRQLSREALSRQGLIQPHVGRMYLYFYQPEGLFTLPHYDMFPVIFMMGMKKETFQGMNLHYIPLDLRRELFQQLLERTNKRSYDRQTFLRISYDFLNSFRKYRAFKPCFKQYRYKNVRGRIVNVPSDDWEIVMNLPTAMFRKQSEQLIHAQSRRVYRNN